MKPIVLALAATLAVSLLCTPRTLLAADPAMQRAVSDAQRDLAKDQAALKQIREKALQQFEADLDYTTAKENLEKAQADYKAAVAPVLEELRAKPEYKAAFERKNKATAEYEGLSKSGTAGTEQLTAASSAAVAAGAELTAMENAALASSKTVVDAKAKQAEAADALKKIRAKFEETLKDNQPYQDQLKLVEESKIKVEQAKKALADANAAARNNRPASPPRSAPPPRAVGGGRGY